MVVCFKGGGILRGQGFGKRIGNAAADGGADFRFYRRGGKFRRDPKAIREFRPGGRGLGIAFGVAVNRGTVPGA